jgi:hypothetical protein
VRVRLGMALGRYHLRRAPGWADRQAARAPAGGR